MSVPIFDFNMSHKRTNARQVIRACVMLALVLCLLAASTAKAQADVSEKVSAVSVTQQLTDVNRQIQSVRGLFRVTRRDTHGPFGDSTLVGGFWTTVDVFEGVLTTDNRFSLTVYARHAEMPGYAKVTPDLRPLELDGETWWPESLAISNGEIGMEYWRPSRDVMRGRLTDPSAGVRSTDSHLAERVRRWMTFVNRVGDADNLESFAGDGKQVTLAFNLHNQEEPAIIFWDWIDRSTPSGAAGLSSESAVCLPPPKGGFRNEEAGKNPLSGYLAGTMTNERPEQIAPGVWRPMKVTERAVFLGSARAEDRSQGRVESETTLEVLRVDAVNPDLAPATFDPTYTPPEADGLDDSTGETRVQEHKSADASAAALGDVLEAADAPEPIASAATTDTRPETAARGGIVTAAVFTVVAIGCMVWFALRVRH